MKFFALGSIFCDDGSQFYFAIDDDSPRGDTPKCHLCDKFLGGIPALPPVRGTLVAERRLSDFGVNFGDEVLLSERCLRIFNEAGIRGLVDPLPIEILDVEGPKSLRQPGAYFLATATRWGADLDRAKSGLRTKDRVVCPECGYAGIVDHFERVSIIESSWRGDDLFTVKGLNGVILASERLHRLCMDNGICVCTMVPAEKHRMFNPFSPSMQ